MAYEVYKYLRNNVFPIVVGGDHSIAIGSVSGTKMAFRNSASGWCGSMPMPTSTAPSQRPAECARDALGPADGYREQEAAPEQAQGVHLGCVGPPSEDRFERPQVAAQRLGFIGLRDYEAEEAAIIKEFGIKVITVKDVREKGTDAVVRETMAHLTASAAFT
ncbi:MAG: arginase family protein [Flavobacteriales bacterium]|nr:arginase family protein [Flavobacteriales bacterium]